MRTFSGLPGTIRRYRVKMTANKNRTGNMIKADPGHVNNMIYCTRQFWHIRLHCVTKETMVVCISLAY